MTLRDKFNPLLFYHRFLDIQMEIFNLLEQETTIFKGNAGG